MKGEHPYVKWAIKVIENYVKFGKKIAIPDDLPKELYELKRACFVTLYTLDGRLRGCIGTIEPYYQNLAVEIRENAIAAATRDPRFPPVQENELDNIEVHVDVLGELEEVKNLEELDPKKFGVVVESGWKRGVLLPDIEGVDTVQQQLEIAKMKAGIFPGEAFKIYKFKVERYK